jgi:hypothetical protein
VCFNFEKYTESIMVCHSSAIFVDKYNLTVEENPDIE